MAYKIQTRCNSKKITAGFYIIHFLYMNKKSVLKM